MARPVQLAPGSLALVLGPLEEREAVEAAEEPGGRSVFRAFRRANARCPWDARLARAASRLAFVGWLRRAVLLVRAPPACLQVLRDAWRRRALRPPRGFRIRAVGECGARREDVPRDLPGPRATGSRGRRHRLCLEETGPQSGRGRCYSPGVPGRCGVTRMTLTSESHRFLAGEQPYSLREALPWLSELVTKQGPLSRLWGA